MNIKLIKTKASEKVDCQAYFFFTDSSLEKQGTGIFFSREVWQGIARDFKPTPGSVQVVYLPTGERGVFVGLGERKKINNYILRQAVQQAVMQAVIRNCVTVILHLENIPKINEQTIELISYATVYGSYRFVWHKHPKKGEEPKNLETVYFSTNQHNKKILKAIERGRVIGQSVNSIRDLANHPANIATPTHIAEYALKTAKQFGFVCKILEEKDIKKEGLGLIMGVGAGSDEPSKFIILEYGNKKLEPVVLIGKGLTFDSGGISIKPSDGMEEMKFDMAGGATVLGIFEVLAKLKVPGHFVGLIPAVENLVSGKAMKPGDILTAQDGKTVEIINTDAEGRMVVADAICYAKKYYNPKFIFDYATLTGAIIHALGDFYTGIFSNTEKFDPALQKGSKLSAEAFWKMPLAYEYKKQINSEVADLKNIGDRGSAGASTAALFLQSFIGEVDWVHFDIAGTAWNTKAKYYQSLGATGWGVYLTLNFLRQLKESGILKV
jgi:leucyl aminopeptidase